MSYHGMTTRMDLGLNKTHVKLFSTKGGMRRNVPHVLLAITDGKSDHGEKEFTSTKVIRVKQD